MAEFPKIAVGRDHDGWDKRFAEALDENIARGNTLVYAFLDLTRHDWLEQVRPYDVVIWKSDAMGVSGSAHFKEKIYILEKYLGKVVVPNYNTVWHFESKIAESYLFSLAGVPTPDTFVTFDDEDAQARLTSLPMPVVFKQSHGAAGKNVRLLNSRRQVSWLLERAFCGERYKRARQKGGPRYRTVLALARKRWFWQFLVQHLSGREIAGHVYWQDYVTGNDADLRITVIGDRYAYGFWRKNRPNDFRASGSGRVDFERPIPEAPLRYCMELNRRMGFDTMAYDILFRDGEFVINEMSYGYLDTVPYKASGHYEADDSNSLTFLPGHVWPQTLWVAWAIRKFAASRQQKI